MGGGRPAPPRLLETTRPRAGGRLSTTPFEDEAPPSRQQRLVFGEVAETYDRVRPTYPPALFDQVFDYAGLGPDSPARVCESGAGTGKATMVVAPRVAAAGWSLTCVEPDEQMAGILRRHLAGVNGLESSIVVSGFEQFADSVESGREPGGFDLLFAAQSWHWVSPERRAMSAASILKEGATLALVWNVARSHQQPLKRDLDRVYGRVLRQRRWLPGGGRPLPAVSPQPPGSAMSSEAQRSYEKELETSGCFGEISTEAVTWSGRYSAAEWRRVLETHSDHRMLADDVRTRLLDDVDRVVERHGGVVEVTYDAVAILAKRTAA